MINIVHFLDNLKHLNSTLSVLSHDSPKKLGLHKLDATEWCEGVVEEPQYSLDNESYSHIHVQNLSNKTDAFGPSFIIMKQLKRLSHAENSHIIYYLMLNRLSLL